MLHLLTLFGLGMAGKEIVSEKLEKPLPRNVRFDWDAYWADVRHGMSSKEQLKKRARGGYYTTKPLSDKKQK